MKARMLCQSCGRSGVLAVGALGKPRWCRCSVSKSGPIVSSPGTVLVYRFEDDGAAAFRERCRVLANAAREARDNLSSRFVRCGRGWRELPRTSPKRRVLEAAYRNAKRALVAVQAECPHDERSHFDPSSCGTCHMHVESNIEQHRHLVREGLVAA